MPGFGKETDSLEHDETRDHWYLCCKIRGAPSVAVYISVLLWERYEYLFFFFSSRRRHTRFDCDWSSDVCSSDLPALLTVEHVVEPGSRATGTTTCSTVKSAGSPTGVSQGSTPYLPPSTRRSTTREIGRASCRERV